MTSVKTIQNGLEIAPDAAVDDKDQGQSPARPFAWGDLTVRKAKTLILPPEYGEAVIKILPLTVDELSGIQIRTHAGTRDFDRPLFNKLVVKAAVVEPAISEADLRHLGQMNAGVITRIIDEAIKPEALKLEESPGESSPD